MTLCGSATPNKNIHVETPENFFWKAHETDQEPKVIWEQGNKVTSS
jgi:hypothetical protein